MAIYCLSYYLKLIVDLKMFLMSRKIKREYDQLIETQVL